MTGAEIQKATLRLFIGGVGRAGSFEVSRVQGDWNEATLSFEAAAGLVGTVEAIVPVEAGHANEYLLVDLTALVKAWVDGTQPNDGIALVPIGDVNLQFDSKEAKGTSHDPRLEIMLSPPETANWRHERHRRQSTPGDHSHHDAAHLARDCSGRPWRHRVERVWRRRQLAAQ